MSEIGRAVGLASSDKIRALVTMQHGPRDKAPTFLGECPVRLNRKQCSNRITTGRAVFQVHRRG